MNIALYLKKELVGTEIESNLKKKINEFGFFYDEDRPDVVIFVGGDGSFLRAVNKYLNRLDDIKFIGLNEGTLGFYSDFSVEKADEAFNAIKNNDYRLVSTHLLEAKLHDKTIYAVNEIRLENPFHTLISKVYIDNEYLETYRGNGLSVSSSFGSSAYNKSLGGAIVIPTIETIQLSEIAPINNRVYRSINSSIIVSKDQSISLEGEFSEAVFGYDHLTIREDVKRIDIKVSRKALHIIYRKGHSFVGQLKEAFLK